MAPNKKKKKAMANSVRGFATVSQPSKPKETREPIDQDRVETRITHDIPEQNNQPARDPTTVSASLQVTDMAPDELEAYLEDAELQNIIDTNLARSNQDAFKQMAKLDQERRQLRAQAHKLPVAQWLPEDIVDEVLQKRMTSAPDTMNNHRYPPANDCDILLKVWTLRRVLTALKLPRIDDAIENTLRLLISNKTIVSGEYIWGLEQALDWYAVACPQEDLPDYEHGNVISAEKAITPADDTSELVVSKSDDDQHVSSDKSLPVDDVLPDDGLNAADLSQLSPSESDNDEPALLTEKYLRLRTLLFRTEKRILDVDKTSPKLEERRSRLLKRIDRIYRDVLFDNDAADAIWNQSLRELEVEAAITSRRRTIKSKGMYIEQENEKTSDDGESFLGDMFVMDDENVCSQLEEKRPGNIRSIDFGQWTGIQPRRLLEENCRASDVNCRFKFTTISATSYAVRQRIHVKWSVDRALEDYALSAMPVELECKSSLRSTSIEMVSIAAASSTQAESYLSTAFLFLLIQSKYCDSKQSTRLPTIWRDICDDLNDARKLLVHSDEKDNLRSLQTLIRSVKSQMENDSESNTTSGQRISAISSTSNEQRRDHGINVQGLPQAQWESRARSTAYQDMLKVRQRLPVHGFKQQILEAISHSQSVIICADTGAGKSTQVPSFLLEDQLTKGQDCRILVTQPRRISAISLAKRVSQELGEAKVDLGTERSLVGYAIRLESKTSRSTRITYATTGVLLRMIESAPDLEHLDYLILDEVHERSMDLDLLFIVLRRLQQRRNSLKIILMSATVDAEKFSTYFGGIPVLNVPGRTFRVEVKHLEDAIEETLELQSSSRVIDGYSDDDADNESETKKLEATKSINVELYSSKTRSKLAQMDEYRIDYQLTASLAEVIATKEKYKRYSKAILIFMPGLVEIRRLNNELLTRDVFTQEFVIHLLHSAFSTEDLENAFAVPPPGYRKIVIATNIAETGITIPDVTAVIDTCKEKVMRFDERRQLSRLTEGFISRSSARQRRGRAARVQEGLCFHLVTQHRFEHHMLEQHIPEMLRLSLQDPILRIKVWNLGSIEDVLGSALDPPSAKNVRRAIEKLKDAGALSSTEKLTALGKRIVQLPLEVVLGKFAIFGIIFRCLDATLTMIAALSSKSPFMVDKNGSQADPRLAFARGESDLISTFNAYQGWRKARIAGLTHQHCQKYHLSDRTLSTIEDQKVQLLVYLADSGLLDLSQEERSSLNKSRNTTNHKTFFNIPSRYNKHTSDEMLNSVIAMVFYPKILVREGKRWRNVYTNQHVSLSPGSINRSVDRPPKWLCFYEAMQVRSGTLNVLETSKIPEIAIVLTIGAADFKNYAGVISLDNGRIKFCVKRWKQLAAIKVLREALDKVLTRCWQTPNLWLSELDRGWIDTFASIVAARGTKLT